MYVGRGAGGIHAHSGKEFNRVNASDPASEAVYVDDHGYNVSPGAPARRFGGVWASCMPNVANCTDLCPPSTRADDPCHGMSCVTEQIYGYAKPVGVAAQPTMTGFVQNAAGIKHNISNPMSMFTPTSAPIIRWEAGRGARCLRVRVVTAFHPLTPVHRVLWTPVQHPRPRVRPVRQVVLRRAGPHVPKPSVRSLSDVPGRSVRRRAQGWLHTGAYFRPPD